MSSLFLTTVPAFLGHWNHRTHKRSNGVFFNGTIQKRMQIFMENRLLFFFFFLSHKHDKILQWKKWRDLPFGSRVESYRLELLKWYNSSHSVCGSVSSNPSTLLLPTPCPPTPSHSRGPFHICLPLQVHRVRRHIAGSLLSKGNPVLLQSHFSGAQWCLFRLNRHRPWPTVPFIDDSVS